MSDLPVAVKRRDLSHIRRFRAGIQFLACGFWKQGRRETNAREYS